MGGLATCGLLLAAASERQSLADQDRLVRFSIAAEAAIQQRIDTYIEALNAASAFLRASDRVSRSEWREFAASLDLVRRYPGIRGIGVVYPVSAGDVAAFVNRVRADGAPEFAVKGVPNSEAAGDLLGLVTYIEPFEENHASLGGDILREPKRRAVALAARDRGEARMTSRVARQQDAGVPVSSLIYVPVYRGGSHPASIDERQRSHVAWVFAPIVAEEVVRGAMEGRTEHLRLAVYEGLAPARQHLMYASDASAVGVAYERVSRLELAGQPVTLGWSRGPEFDLPTPKSQRWAAAVGVLAAVLLAGLVFSLQSTGRRARKLARELTREMSVAQQNLERSLRLQQTVLDGTDHAVIAVSPDGVITIFNRGAERILGYSRDEVVGKCTPAGFHLKSEVEARAGELSVQLGFPVAAGFEALVALARRGVLDEREWTYVRKDGSYFPVLLSVTAVRDDKGTITGFVGIAQDLTERKKSEIALRQTEERLGRVLGHAECLVWEAKVALTPSDWTWRMAVFPSALYRRLLDGRSPSSSAGLWYQFEVPDQTEMNRRARDAMERGLPGYVQEFRLVRPDGETLWLRESVAVNQEQPGHYWLIGVAIDITDWKRAEQGRLLAEENLVRSQRLLQTVTSILPGLVAYWTADLRCAFANGEYETWFGRTPAQMREITLPELLGPELYARNERYVRGVLAGEPQQFERELTKANGDVRYTWAQYIPDFDHDRKTVRGFVVLVSDVTEMKRQQEALRTSEARVRASLQEVTNLQKAMDAHAIVAITDAAGRITYANDRFLSISKYSREEVVGRTHRVVNSGYHPPEFFADLWATITAGQIWRGEICNQAKDGQRYWVAATIVPFLGEDGRPIQYIAIRTDITGRKELEQRLAVARDEALEASRLKSEFLAMMSHEIRTPMNAIIGMSGLLAQTELTGDQGEMVRTVSRAAEGLLAIINDILDFSRIEAGQLRLDADEFDLARIVAEAVSLLAASARAKGLRLGYAITPAPGQALVGDAGRVRQVLLNLLSNAVKFTDRGEVRLDVSLSPEEDRTRVRIEVRDTGIGIPLSARERLFNAFVQVDGSPSRRFGGTGLGLAITRQLVTAMGGKVGFESEVGRGSTFWAEIALPTGAMLPPGDPAPALPLRRIVVPDVPLPTMQPALAPHSAPPGKLAGLRVLLVEDNPANQNVACRLLQQLGHRAEVAVDGHDALRRLSAASFDVVLMDCQMPGLDGFETSRIIRSGTCRGIDASVPIIALTAYARTEDRIRCESAGMEGYVSKPIRTTELAQELERVVGRRGAAAPAPPEEAFSAVVLDPVIVESARRLPGANGPSLLPELIQLYLADEGSRLESIRQAASTRSSALAIEAHGFASNAASLGGIEVRERALALERAARAGRWNDVETLVGDLLAAGERLRTALETLS